MSKIDDYRAKKSENESAISLLDRAMGKFDEDESRQFDPEKSVFEFSNSPLNEHAPIYLTARYGYLGSTLEFSVLVPASRRCIIDALNMYADEIVQAAQRFLQEEIDKARADAKEEAQDIMGEFCSCGKCSVEEGGDAGVVDYKEETKEEGIDEYEEDNLDGKE